MIQIQDDPTTPVLNNATVVSDNQVSDTKKEASIDELLAQLEALNQEIARKQAQTPVAEPSFESPSENVEPAQVEPSLSQPALEPVSTEEPKKNDFDLDAFIKDLEEKIAQQNVAQDAVVASPTESASVNETPASEPAAADEDEFFRKLRQRADLREDESSETAAPETAAPAAVAPEVAAAPSQDSNPDLDQLIADLEKSLKEYEANQSKPTMAAEQNPNGELQLPEDLVAAPAPTPEPVSAYEPAPAPAPTVEPTPAPEPTPEPANPETLEAQNIFDMLNLNQLTETEKESFLNDLEKLIWDNFIEIDLPLLLSAEEKTEADRLMAASDKSEDERKESLLVYLDKLVPNLEQVMYQKAIALKKELFDERLRKMRDQAQASNDLSALADLDQIDDLLQAERYQTAVKLLNKG